MEDPAAQRPHRLAVVGSFTTPERGARGRGLSSLRILADGSWQPAAEQGDLDNPSFLIADPGRALVHVAHGDGETVSTLAADRATGALTLLGRIGSGGRNGVHLALSPDGRFLLVANYASGNVAVLRRDEAGLPVGLADVLALQGVRGPHRDEQQGAHPHQIVFSPDGRFVLVPDKGLDRVFVLGFDPASGRLDAGPPAMPTRPGAGPRHLVLDGKRAFVLGELDSTLTTASWDAATGRLVARHVASLLPPDCFTPTAASAIVLSADRRCLFASNRGHDSIARFAIPAGGGAPRPLGWTPAGGACPRFMGLGTAPDELLVALEQADRISRLRITPAGDLVATGAPTAIASPACIAML